MRKHLFCSLACLFLVWLGMQNAFASRPVIIPPGDYSVQYIREARESAAEAIRNNPQITNAQLQEEVLNAIYANHPSINRYKEATLLTIQDCETKSAKILAAKAAEKFPALTEKQLNREAELKYPMYKKGDRIIVQYRKRPQVIDKITGAFYGFTGNEVRVANRRIVVQDMVGIEGNDVELTKLNPELNQALRQEYKNQRIAKQKENRQNFIRKNDEGFFDLELKKTANANEKNGYVFSDGHWIRLQNLVQTICDNMLKANQTALEQAKQQQGLRRNDAIQHIPDSLALSAQMTLHAGRPDIQQKITDAQNAAKNAALAKLAAQKAAEKAAAEKAAAEKAAAEKAAAEKAKIDQEKTAAEQPKQLTPEEERMQAEAKQRELELQLEQQNRARNLKFFITLAVVLVVILIAGGGIYLKMHKKEDENRFAKFFEGKGKLQKTFWDMAKADPENFKYVAYMFPSVEEANNALCRLSYITANANGDLKSTKSIYYGSYAHHGNAVAFVGGTKLNYAAWKEASALLPELEGAQYFKVSTAPVVTFVPPDSSLMGDKIQKDGMEELQNEDGSIILCYTYTAANKEDALEFLQHFNVDESDVLIRVSTPEGDVCKNEDGMVEMEVVAPETAEEEAADEDIEQENASDTQE